MEIIKSQLEKIEKFVNSKLDSLNWHHTQEVRKIAQKLARLEKADNEIVEVAVLFHDLGKIKTTGLGHAEVSAAMARKFLEKDGYEQRFIEEVVYCIIVHSYPVQNKSNLINTVEAKVVYDSDVIQKLSKFGIIKAIFDFEEIFKKDFKGGLMKSRDVLFGDYNLIFTENGRKMAEEGYKFIKDFYRQLL